MAVLLLTSSLSAMLSQNCRLVWHKKKIKDLKVTVLLSLDVACSGSNSRMRLFPRGGTFYTMFFPCF